MKIDFEEPDGLGWAVILAVIALAIIFLVGIATSHSENAMKMALEAGCSEMRIPDSTVTYWGNCTKGLPSSR